jgi:hypothetical protein
MTMLNILLFSAVAVCLFYLMVAVVVLIRFIVICLHFMTDKQVEALINKLEGKSIHEVLFTKIRP